MKEHVAALAHYKRTDKIMHAAARVHVRNIGPRKALRTNAALFAALAESVVSQQLAVKAADAIWARVLLACGGKVTPESVRATALPNFVRPDSQARKQKHSRNSQKR